MPYSKHLLSFLLFFIMVSTITGQEQLSTLSLKELHRFTEKNPEEGYVELIKRYERSKVRQNPRQQLATAKYLARYGYLVGKNPIVEQYMKEVDSLLTILSDVPFDTAYHNFLIAFAIANKDAQQAINYLNLIKEDIKASKDTSWIINYHCQSARAYASFDDHAVSLRHLLDAELLNEHHKDEALQAFIYTAYASVYWEQRKHEKAYEKDLLAMQYYESTQNYRNLLPAYINLMTKAIHLNKKEEALVFAEKYDQLKKQFGTQLGFFSNELNQIFFYIEMGKYKRALKQAQYTIKLAKKMKRDSSHALYLMGVAYRGLKQFDLAAKYIEKAFNEGKVKQHNGKCSFYSHALYQTYYWDFQYKPALDWFQTHISYKDSVYNEKKAKEIAVFESRIEALEQRQKAEELKAKMEIERQQNRVLWISIILGSLLAFALMYAQRQRANKEKVKQESLYLKTHMEKEQLKQQLEFKQREITTQILHMAQKNSLLKGIQDDLSNLITSENKYAISKLSRTIKNNLNDVQDWDYFLKTFKSVHSSFLQNLQSINNNLSSNEIRLASLMKMNMSSKEIATILNISGEGVKKARYRLRKKLQLNGEKNLQDFLLQL